jgi:hypothetical protein
MGDHYGASYLNGGTGKKNILSKDRFLRDLFGDTALGEVLFILPFTTIK